MNYVLTNEEMKKADEYTVNALKIPSLILMERAGRALAREAAMLAPTGKILCLCGGGNNGGDGFVCARILKEEGRAVDVVCIAKKTSDDCAVNMKRWQDLGGTIGNALLDEGYACAVDCLFGTGFHGSLQGEEGEAVLALNRLKEKGMKVLSADIPSGVDGKNGSVQGVAVCADVTLCIGEIKTGVLLGDGLDYAGEIKRADIGIQLPEKRYARLLDGERIASLLPKRRRNSHKGTYGRAAIVGGSMEYTGAAYLSYASASACLRAGAGYTALFVPKEILPYYILKSPEILIKEACEGNRYAFNEEIMRELLAYNAVAYGMGMGISEEVAKGARWLLEKYGGRLVLDADGLNSLAVYYKGELSALFAHKKCDVILTPHAKEFSRLSGWNVQEILLDSIRLSRSFAKSNGVSLLLKNAVSILTDGEELYLNTTGNSALAKGGSGDVLAGLAAGLCASGLSALEGGCCAAYLLGKAAEIGSEKDGEYSLTATDVIAHLGAAFLFVTENSHEDGGKE